MSRPRIVIGLGNPGLRYEATRHNVGFWVVDALSDRLGLTFGREGDLGRKAWYAIAEGTAGTTVLLKPRTYMNRSGRAAVAARETFGAIADDFVAVYDDVDLDLGRIRVRPSGRPGGHNGVRSLIDALGTAEFPRVRIGVRGAGREGEELADYVLAPFPEEEQRAAAAAALLAADAVGDLLSEDLTTVMNRYNGRRVPPDAAGERSDEG